MSSRIPFVVGNWKMNGLGTALIEIAAIAAALEAGAAGRATCALCPPVTLLERAASAARGRLAVGAQDCAVEPAGAFTGDISAEMLRDAGASLVIVGHSERRAGHGETDAIVQAKAEAAMRAGLTAIVCVGESQAEHDAGQARPSVASQIKGSVPLGASAETLVIAYEPVWAIGTGRTPTNDDVAAMHGVIRSQLADMLGAAAGGLRLLYGGSVKPDNAAALMAVPDVDGALVGGASLRAKDFLGIAGVYREPGTA